MVPGVVSALRAATATTGPEQIAWLTAFALEVICLLPLAVVIGGYATLAGVWLIRRLFRLGGTRGADVVRLSRRARRDSPRAA